MAITSFKKQTNQSTKTPHYMQHVISRHKYGIVNNLIREIQLSSSHQSSEGLFTFILSKPDQSMNSVSITQDGKTATPLRSATPRMAILTPSPVILVVEH